ncbi:MAG: membrane protein insertion efficiency factor YidD [Candidatus Omnitrophica bacterium]|nr:membrane protein insertion efficiency factor YidD [Candidatus Omnitrophota bacterium]MDD5595728.1 membrane protein insertion efficiency factor YidD [Candidatus Omnitrophota bacterium]
MQKISLKLLEFYQGYIRILLPCACRFSPSCSEYTKQAIKRYGFLKGALKGMGRLLRCHPFSGKAGYDPLK